MMVVMAAFSWVTSYMWALALQLMMDVCSAMQKMSGRLLIADSTERGMRGALIGSYHFWTSIASGLAVLIGGDIIDWLTIHALFISARSYTALAPGEYGGPLNRCQTLLLARILKQGALAGQAVSPIQNSHHFFGRFL